MTGWADTPDKQDFFTVAENATNKGNALRRIKADMEKVVQATKSPENTEELITRYDVNTALTGVIHHIISHRLPMMRHQMSKILLRDLRITQ